MPTNWPTSVWNPQDPLADDQGMVPFSVMDPGTAVLQGRGLTHDEVSDMVSRAGPLLTVYIQSYKASKIFLFGSCVPFINLSIVSNLKACQSPLRVSGRLSNACLAQILSIADVASSSPFIFHSFS